MKLTPEQRRIARTILEHPDDGFVALTRLAGLDPATAWVGADLRGVICCENVRGFVFHQADLRGADFSRAHGKNYAMFEGAIVDAATRGVPQLRPASHPPDFDLAQARHMILSGEAPPKAWWPFIRELSLSSQPISDLSSLSGLTALQSLHLRGTQVSDLAPLSGLTALESLGLMGAQVSDLSPLSSLTVLKRLDLGGTQVSDLSPLSGLTVLERLDLGGTQVSDLSPLSGLTVLQRLGLSGTLVDDVSPLSGLTALQRVNLRGTPVSDMSPLSALTALQSLNLRDTQVNDISPLSGLPALQTLNLRGTRAGAHVAYLRVELLSRYDSATSTVLGPFVGITPTASDGVA